MLNYHESNISKTCLAFKKALFTAAQQKPLYSVHITDICSISGYHRSTFYLYFNDIYELINICLEDTASGLSCSSIFNNTDFTTDPREKCIRYLREMLIYTKNNASQIAIFITYATKEFHNKLYKFITTSWNNILLPYQKEVEKKAELSYICNFIAYLCLSLIHNSIYNDNNSIEILSDQYGNLLSLFLDSVISSNDN